MRTQRKCPKCGSLNVNAETVRGEPRYHWCLDCKHGEYHAFPLIAVGNEVRK